MLKLKNQGSALKHLHEIGGLFGAIKRIIVDHNSDFVSHYKIYRDSYGIGLHQGAGYVSRAKGQVESYENIKEWIDSIK